MRPRRSSGGAVARTRWANPMRARGETERRISAGEGEADIAFPVLEVRS
jgi:hypothetical protein